MGNAWPDWAWAMLLAALGIVARLGHTWAKSKDGAVPPLGARDIIAALIAAPALGIIAYGLGSWLNLCGAAVGAACGFAGLLGPAALIAAWDKIADAALAVFKSRNGGGWA